MSSVIPGTSKLKKIIQFILTIVDYMIIRWQKKKEEKKMSELLVVSLFFIVLNSGCLSGLTGGLKYILNKNKKNTLIKPPFILYYVLIFIMSSFYH